MRKETRAASTQQWPAAVAVQPLVPGFKVVAAPQGAALAEAVAIKRFRQVVEYTVGAAQGLLAAPVMSQAKPTRGSKRPREL